GATSAPTHFSAETTARALRRMTLRSCVLMKNGFDPVAVGIARERRVVAGAVLRSRAGRAFVDGAHAERRRVERIDRLAARRGERDVTPDARRARLGARREHGERFVLRARQAPADPARV